MTWLSNFLAKNQEPVKQFTSSMNLVEHIEATYGGKTSRAISDFFNAMSMPVPEYSEYRKGYHLFLDDYAVVLSITNDFKDPHIIHPLILQPLGSRMVEGLRIDLKPGLKTPAKNSGHIAFEIKKDGVDFWDSHARNCGDLPALNDNEHGQAVILDPNSFEDFSFITEEAKARRAAYAAPGGMDHTIQYKLFGGLKKSFDRAWPHYRSTPELHLLKDFFQHCAALKQEKKLIAGWLDDAARDHVARVGYHHGGSTQYAERWRKHGGIGLV